MSPEELEENRLHFEEILYDNLLKVLETRTKNPVSKFAKMILDDAGLNKDGDPIADKGVPKRSDRVKVSKGNIDDEAPKKKEKKNSGDDDSAEEERLEQEKAEKSKAARKEKKAAKKVDESVV